MVHATPRHSETGPQSSSQLSRSYLALPGTTSSVKGDFQFEGAEGSGTASVRALSIEKPGFAEELNVTLAAQPFLRVETDFEFCAV